MRMTIDTTKKPLLVPELRDLPEPARHNADPMVICEAYRSLLVQRNGHSILRVEFQNPRQEGNRMTVEFYTFYKDGEDAPRTFVLEACDGVYTPVRFWDYPV